jgi:urease accessory protein
MQIRPPTAIPMRIRMTERAGGTALLRLMNWLSPAFPVGGFAYSHGLERAVHDGLVSDRAELQAWLAALLEIGSGWNDAVLFAEAWRRARDGGDLVDLAELAEALAGSGERHAETMLQGAAFLAAAAGWPNPV